jgi:hypothetical protein
MHCLYIKVQQCLYIKVQQCLSTDAFPRFCICDETESGKQDDDHKGEKVKRQKIKERAGACHACIEKVEEGKS